MKRKIHIDLAGESMTRLVADGLSQTEDEQTSLEDLKTLMGKNQGSGLRTRSAQRIG